MAGSRTIEVRVYGSHRCLLPGGDSASVIYVEGETLKSLLSRLNIPWEDVGVLVVNDVLVSDEHVLSPGDRVAVMSPVGGG